MSMNILSLDLGSTTGIAWNSDLSAMSVPQILSRTWATDKELRDMRARRLDRRGDIRVIRFFDYLTNLHESLKFNAVVIEDVQFSSSTAQTQLWSSFRTTVWLAFPKTLIEAVPVGTLKKFATGSGSADKNAMMTALANMHPEMLRANMDDNGCDAAWLWLWAKTNLGRTKL
jgi:hypothetical protein